MGLFDEPFPGYQDDLSGEFDADFLILEWLTGKGKTHRELGPNTPFTQELRDFSVFDGWRQQIAEKLKRECEKDPSITEFPEVMTFYNSYSPSDGGVWKGIWRHFIKQLWGGVNKAEMFLGGFPAKATVTNIDCCGITADIRWDIDNKSTFASAFRFLPYFDKIFNGGNIDPYSKEWEKVGEAMRQNLIDEYGLDPNAMRPRTQHVYWSESMRLYMGLVNPWCVYASSAHWVWEMKWKVTYKD